MLTRLCRFAPMFAFVICAGPVASLAEAQPAQPRLVATFTTEDKGQFKHVGPLRFSPDGRTLAILTGEGLVL